MSNTGHQENAEMHTTSTLAAQPGWARSSGPMIDRYALVSVAAFIYVVIALPLYIYLTTSYSSGKSIQSVLQNLMTPNPINKVFWPASGPSSPSA